MRQILNIAWKDLRIVARDPGALVLLVITPFALTMAMASAFGAFDTGGSSSPIAAIPVVVVNQDAGELGQSLVDLFASDAMKDVALPTTLQDPAAARLQVDGDQTAAAVIIPADLTAIVTSSTRDAGGRQTVIEVYTNPTRPIGASVIRGIVDRFLYQLASGAAAADVSLSQMAANGLIAPQDMAAVAPRVAAQAVASVHDTQLVRLASETGAAPDESRSQLWVYMGPSMAIMFLMFTAANGGRALLQERDSGTLGRLLASPTSATQVLGGKVVGTFATGLAQLVVLLGASALVFGRGWGGFPQLALVVFALVAAATAWGTLISALARTSSQAYQMGIVLTLVFAMISGNFINRSVMPAVLQRVSMITPNAWGLEAFTKLVGGASLGAVAPAILALLGMAVVLFVAAVFAFRRQFA